MEIMNLIRLNPPPKLNFCSWSDQSEYIISLDIGERIIHLIKCYYNNKKIIHITAWNGYSCKYALNRDINFMLGDEIGNYLMKIKKCI